MRAVTCSAFCLALAPLAAPLLGQGLTVKSVVDVRLQGALGAVANMASRLSGSSMHDMPSITYISGHKLRTESGSTATIIDADAGRITSIDNKAQTYSSMTFDEMADAMKRAQQSAKNGTRDSQDSRGAKDPSAPKGEMNVKYKVAVDRPGQRENIAGYNAERMFVTITMDADVTPEGGKTEQAGGIVLLMDQWISKDAPQSQAMAEFSRAYSKKAGQAFKSQIQGMQGVFSADPRMKGGFDAAASEMAKIQGTPLRSTIYFTLVPAPLQFDRNLALSDAGVAAKDAKANQDNKPKGGGGLGGLMGRLKVVAQEASKQSDTNQSTTPHQATVVTMTDEVRSITPGAPADVFSPPAGYRELKTKELQPN